MGSVAGIRVIELEHNSAGSYGPSKSLMHALTRDWAVFLARRHILVNAIAPGLFPSGMTDDKAFQEKGAQLNRLKRIGNQQDMAGIALFLGSKASNFMTGEVIKLDGGFTL